MTISSVRPALELRRVYSTWFEGLLIRALGDRLTPALISDLRAAGLDVDAKLAPHYPATLRLECLRLLREHLFADLTEEQAWNALGHAAFEGIMQTMVGQAFATVYRMLGPRAVLKGAGRAMAAASNYITAESIELGPLRWHIRLEGTDLPPAYYLGLVSAALELCKVSGLRVSLESHVGETIVVGCSWGPRRS